MSGAEQRSVVAENFLWDSKPCKYLLQVVDDAKKDKSKNFSK